MTSRFSSKIRKRKGTQQKKADLVNSVAWRMKGAAEATGSPGGPTTQTLGFTERGGFSLCNELTQTRDTCSPRVTSAALGRRRTCVEGGEGHPPPFERGMQAGRQGWPASWRLTSRVDLSGPLKTGPQTKILCVCVRARACMWVCIPRPTADTQAARCRKGPCLV